MGLESLQKLHCQKAWATLQKKAFVALCPVISYTYISFKSQFFLQDPCTSQNKNPIVTNSKK